MPKMMSLYYWFTLRVQDQMKLQNWVILSVKSKIVDPRSFTLGSGCKYEKNEVVLVWVLETNLQSWVHS